MFRKQMALAARSMEQFHCISHPLSAAAVRKEQLCDLPPPGFAQCAFEVFLPTTHRKHGSRAGQLCLRRRDRCREGLYRSFHCRAALQTYDRECGDTALSDEHVMRPLAAPALSQFPAPTSDRPLRKT